MDVHLWVLHVSQNFLIEQPHYKGSHKTSLFSTNHVHLKHTNRVYAFMCSCRIPVELVIDLGLEELTLSELLEVETALDSFMLSVLLLKYCHIIVEMSRLSSL